MFKTYHSTPEHNIESILSNGFQKRYGNNYGLTFGDGIYTTSSILYASTYNIECDKILLCEIVTDNYLKLTSYEYRRMSRKKYLLEKYDLIIITDCDEYVCKILETIKVIDVLNIKREIENNQVKSVSVI